MFPPFLHARRNDLKPSATINLFVVCFALASCGNSGGSGEDTDSGVDGGVSTTDTGIGSDTALPSDTGVPEPDAGDDAGPPLVPPAGCEEAIVFPDMILSTAVRDAIGKSAGDIFYADVAPLTSLVPAADLAPIINNLEGIQCVDNLTELDLSTNQIADISQLAALTKLETLILKENQVSDLSPLAGLVSLTHLDLSTNQVSDIAPLGGLESLQLLDLTENSLDCANPDTQAQLAGHLGRGVTLTSDCSE
jgi:hypothetical protein